MRLISRALFVLALGLAGAYYVRTYVVEAVYVASGSMNPTLFVGGHYFVNRLSYRFREPQRGDIIVFSSPVDNSLGLIKRVIAVAGDDIEIRNKQVFLNGQLLDEPYAVHSRARERLEGDTIGPMKVPAGCVFVLGDNRDESSDSSIWKNAQTGERVYFLPIQNIKGKLIQLT